eukprot:CAMPEP_0119570644 /NCGR_PEP_ID=MMETSP1352-20130426/43716_1 /TAXON_ID=265584 /ORGANISM="Stauroneis constricta, Strain CCMP1120" /LENGTH=1964 /DNA_ID=CAMNT_0007620313 /DNA_START=556 /DNA_END=6450 /DNA_ORIENTATION=+
MLGSRSFGALMRRNLIYRRRNLIGTLLEFILPVGFIAILVAIKASLEGNENFSARTVPASFPTDSVVPFSFGDYVKALQAERTCVAATDTSGGFSLEDIPEEFQGRIPDSVAEELEALDVDLRISGMNNNGYNWQVPFVLCDSQFCDDLGQDASSLCEYLALGIAPLNEADTAGLEQADAFVEYVYSRYPVIDPANNNNNADLPFNFDFIQRFKSDGAINSYVTSGDYKNPDTPKLALGIVFDGTTDPSINYNYHIRVNATGFNSPEESARPLVQTTPPTYRKFERYAKDDTDSCIMEDGGPEIGINSTSCTNQYIYNGALVMQRLVNDWIMVKEGAKDKGLFVSDHGVSFAPFPSYEYDENGFYGVIGGFASLLVTLGLLYPVAAMIRYIVLEKELRQKELMKMMSVTESDIGWSWFLTFWSFHVLTAIATSAAFSSLYENSAFGYILVFWLLTFTATIVFCMVISAFFSKSTKATLFGLLLFFCGYFLTLVADFEDGNIGTIGLVSLHPVAAFAYGIQEIGRLEDAGIGLQAGSISETDSLSGYTFTTTLSNLITDCIVWGIVTWYLNRVVASELGQPLPWYFPFTRSYWCPGSASSTPEGDEEEDETVYADGIPAEQVSDTLKAQKKQGKSIEIRNLRKTFGEKTAVDGLSMSLYRDQITALLGHNGAGKTTTISMLTGMFAPTEGYATIGGKDIRTEMPAIRQEIGICLQHDCLFPMLTVKEHVRFFARIKGMYAKMSAAEAEEKISQSIEDVALHEKRNTFSKNLSGGMKRKLSVAIAFCGDSKTVLLDEPTSGMDPFSRRFTWNVIRQYRRDRCIILTTHFMDEADILGDRIAIMSSGQLRCIGSSLFLKKTYGVGYQLTIEKQPGGAVKGEKEKVDESLTSIVKDAIPESTLLSNVGTELSFQLPLGAASSFKEMFDGLDDNVEDGSIVTYGVGITTLDEVFLLVARGDSADKSTHHLASSRAQIDGEPAKEGTTDVSARSRMDFEKDGLFGSHVTALFQKRALNFKRDKKAWLCTTILPTMFVLLGLILNKYVVIDPKLDPLELTIEDYNGGLTTDRNPIPFNKAGSVYSCQATRCADPGGFVNETNELYGFCGVESTIPQSDLCSISQSDDIISRITEAGAFGDPQEATNVGEASKLLFDSASSYGASQYAAVYFTQDPSSIIQRTNQSYVDTVTQQCQLATAFFNYTSADECQNFGGIGYTIRYNFTALHVAPLYQSLADEAILREALGDNNFKIRTTMHPLPKTQREENYEAGDNAFLLWFLITLSFPFIAGSFATFVVVERQSKAKHLQTVAGVKPPAYWISTWLWDIANYQFPLWLTVILIFIFDVKVFTTSNRDIFSGIITLLILYGPAAASFTYIVSFFFSSPSLCNLVIIISGFLIGLGGSLAAFIMRIIGEDPVNPDESLVTAAKIVEWVFRFFPPFNLSKGLFYTINIEVIEIFSGSEVSAWDERVMLYEVIFLAWQSVVYLFIAMKIDEWSANPDAVVIFQKFVDIITLRAFFCPVRAHGELQINVPDDSDVIAEQERVKSGGANNDMIVIDQLSKVYSNGKMAVNNISLGIPPGQCFSLLGINGAGKTTTMGMLTAEFPPTTGDATLAGFSVSREPEKTRRRVGYCPQFDAHFTNMTGREHVELYASIKGVPKDVVKEAAASKLAEVGLSDFDSDRLSMGYSGGMKRRLSLACATIGQPQIVFLDECSTGVDPVARREIWQMVSDMVNAEGLAPEEQTSVILTTHSMEEAEALCPRIAIMAGGKIRCLGSAQHLKDKFGQGYQVEMKIKNAEKDDADYQAYLERIATGAGVTMPKEDEEQAEIFLTMDQARRALQAVTGDEFLVAMIDGSDPNGYNVYKAASTPVGVDIHEVASFATVEVRIRQLHDFVARTYPNSVMRERQDTKARYEVSSKGVKISSIFQSIEENKIRLAVAEYGVSQTSLEQVFNMHAAEAEKLKHGTNDG